MFALRLAAALGFVSVAEMLSRISPQDFIEWWAYDTIEPLRLGRENWPENVKAITKLQEKMMPVEDFQKIARARYG